MNRRTFTKALGSIVVGAFLGVGLRFSKPALEEEVARRAIVNPEWVTAQFEMASIWHKNALKTILHDRAGFVTQAEAFLGAPVIRDAIAPTRFVLEDDGTMRAVFKYKYEDGQSI